MRVSRIAVGVGSALVVALGAAAASSPAQAFTSASSAARASTTRPVPAGFAPLSVTFVSDQRGWVLGTAPCGSKTCTVVLRTVNGGKSWRRVASPQASTQTPTDVASSVDQLRFANQHDGYADGVGLWQTHNGGTRWTRQRTVAGIKHAVVSDLVASGSSMYALVSGTDTRYGGSDSHIRLARASASTGRFHVIADLGTNQEAGDLVAAGGTVYLLASPIARSNGHLVRVRGTTVTRTRLPTEACSALAAGTSSSLLLVCGAGAGGGAMGSRSLYSSSDSGHHFTRRHSPGRGAGYDTTGVADAAHGRAVVATAATTGAALRSTHDAARTWHTSLKVKNGSFTELGFEDTRHGVVIARMDSNGKLVARLYRTTTAGAHWTRIKFH